MTEEAPWKAALKAMINAHFVLYMLSVVTIGFGAGNIFTFLYWHLQVNLCRFMAILKIFRISAVLRFCSVFVQL